MAPTPFHGVVERKKVSPLQSMLLLDPIPSPVLISTSQNREFVLESAVPSPCCSFSIRTPLLLVKGSAPSHSALFPAILGRLRASRHPHRSPLLCLAQVSPCVPTRCPSSPAARPRPAPPAPPSITADPPLLPQTMRGNRAFSGAPLCCLYKGVGLLTRVR